MKRAASSLAIAAAAMTAASGARCTAPTSSRPEARSRSLVASVDGAAVECPELAALRGEIALSPRDSVELRADFADLAKSDPWLEGIEILDPAVRASRTVVLDPLEQQRALLLPEGAAGLHRLFALKRPESLVISVRLRAIAPGGSPPKLSVLAMDQAPAGADARRSLLDSRRAKPSPSKRMERERREDSVEVDIGAGQDWQVVSLLLPHDARRRALRISVNEGSGVLLGELVIRRPSPAEEIGLARTRTRPEGRHPLVARVRLGDVEMDSLLLPSGTKVRFELPVGDARTRLDTAIGPHPLAGARDADVSLAIDGQVVSSRHVTGGASRFEDWSVSLAAWAGRTVTLELSAAGAPGSVAVLGDPWLLAGAPPRTGPNVVLISIDTLRADALGCYGNRETHTPAMDALAREGTCFRSATSPSSYTLPAHATMLTGQHPLVHGMTRIGEEGIDPARSPLLAIALREAGFQTAAFTGGGLVHPDFGFGAGFDRYSVADVGGVERMFQENAAGLDASRTRFAASAPLFDWLRRRGDQPFFLFLHTYFVHNYVPSRSHAERHRAALRPNLVLANGAAPEDFLSRKELLGSEPGAADGLRRLYFATVDELDERLLGPLLAELDRLGLDDRTLVAVVSDHGDEFQEHGALFHGRSLWNELVHVPFLLRGPGIPAGATRHDRVQLEDVMPTLAARVGLPRDARWSGRDLFAVESANTADTTDSPDSIVEAETIPRILHLDHFDHLGEYRWEGLLLNGYAMLRQHVGDGAPRDYLFDLRKDPAQKDDRSSDLSAQLAAFGRRLDAEMEALRQQAAAAQDRDEALGGEDEELKQRLRELGYGIK